jgi:hypothetical protein
MKKRNLLILIFFTVIISSCKKKEEDNTTIVNGFIIDSLTNISIQDVNVQLYKDELFGEYAVPVIGYETVSYTYGKFYLKFKWEEGFVSYSLKVSKDGFIYSNPSSGDLINIEPRKSQDIVIKMNQIK